MYLFIFAFKIWALSDITKGDNKSLLVENTSMINTDLKGGDI